MLCPNCKTELVEVNGRYICSDCGKEIPENEVMTSDWGNSAPAASGIFGATQSIAPEAGDAPVADYSTSLTDSESSIDPVQKALEEQSTDATLTTETQPATETQSVEQVLASEEPKENPAEPMELPKEEGFYTAPTEQPTPETVPPSPSSEFSSESSETAQSISETAPEVEATLPEVPVASAPEITTEEPVTTTDPVSVEMPISQTVPAFDVAPEPQPVPELTPMAEATPAPEILPEVPETSPQQTEQVVKDMFENVPQAPVSDPNLYAAPSYDQQQPASPNPAVVPTSGRLNLLILVFGALLVLGTIGGGTWAYMSLTAKPNIEINPVITPATVTWQELQVVDGGFKISFPGSPEKASFSQKINGLDSELTNYVLQTDDYVYNVAYATTPATVDKLSDLANEYATLKGMTIDNVKTGKYYSADAVDFKLTLEEAEYKCKIMLYNGKYILVSAGTNNGQAYDFDTFIKSFKFTSGSTD